MLHVTGVAMFWTAALKQNKPPDVDWTKMKPDPLAGFTENFQEFVKELAPRDPDAAAWVWGRDPHVRFWFRRAAQELSIHRWDFESAVGAPQPIHGMLAIDGVDELLQEFGPNSLDLTVEGAGKRFGGDGERLRFEATDAPVAWTITALPESFEVSPDGDGDVTAQGTASDINLFVWGRVPPTAFEVSGDVSLLERWQERVKI